MDSSEAGLDRVEAQRPMGESHNDQRKRSYFPMNLIKRGLRALSLFQTESEPDYLTKLRISDVFHQHGEYKPIDPKIFSGLSEGKEESLEELRNKGIPISYFKSDQGDSVLHLAAACNHLELVKRIVSDCPCLLLELDSKDQLPLHVAAHAGHSSVVDALIAAVGFISARVTDKEKKDKLNLYVVKNKDGDTPLHLALKGRHMGSAKYLVRANRKASFLANKDGKSPLYLAVETGNVTLVKMMLDTRDGYEFEGRYAYLDSHLEGRKNLVHAAFRARTTDTLEFLLKEYPRLVDEQDEEGRTCLWLAASMGYYKGVRMLLDKGRTKDVYTPDDKGSFPVHIALANRHMRVVFLLLKRCPDSKHLLNQQGQNILHIATKSGIGALFLFSYLWVTGWINQLVERQDVNGNSPLHLATQSWRPRTLFVLLGVTKSKWLYVRNNDGKTALDIAEKEVQPNYVFMERVTLMVLLYFYAPISKDSWMKKITKPSEPLDGSKSKDYVNTLLVVAALVATVTFAAGFTIPGGFNSSNGFPAIKDKPKLAFFMIFNIWAMQSSIVTIAILIWGQLGDQALVPMSFNWALRLLFLALLHMVVAFYWGVLVTFANIKGVVIFLNFTYAIFLFLMFFNLGPHVFLQISGVPALFGGYLLTFVMFLDEDGLAPVKKKDPEKKKDFTENIPVEKND